MVTFCRLRSGEWGMRSSTNLPIGSTVSVSKKSGELTPVTVGNYVWSGNGIYLYAINRDRRPKPTRDPVDDLIKETVDPIEKDVFAGTPF